MSIFVTGAITPSLMIQEADAVKADKIYPTEINSKKVCGDRLCSEEQKSETAPSGERDEHGCFPDIGYSWDEEKQECIRPAEEITIEEVPVKEDVIPIKEEEVVEETPMEEIDVKDEVVEMDEMDKTMQDLMILEQLTGDGSVLILVHWPQVVGIEQIYDIEFSFLDPNTKEPITDEIHYRVSAMNKNVVLEVWEGKTTSGSTTHEFLFTEEHSGPSEVYAEIFSITDESGTVENYQEVMWNVNVVPEFPIVFVIMAISFVMIILMRSKISALQIR